MEIHRFTLLYLPRRFSFKALPEHIQVFDPLSTMDEVMFYQPDKTFSSQPPPLPSALTALVASGQSITSPSVRQTVSQVNQQNGISKDQMNESRDVSDLSQKGHTSDQRCRNNTVEEQGTYRDLPSESLHLILWRKLQSNTEFPEQRRR